MLVHILRGYNGYDTDEASLEAGLDCGDQLITIQSEREEADINTLVRRFGLTGQLPVNNPAPQLDMFVDIMDYRDAQNAILEANRSFMAMPPDVRARFQNDAGAFVDFCSDPANLEEMRKLGLAVPKAADAPPPADVPPVIEDAPTS